MSMPKKENITKYQQLIFDKIEPKIYPWRFITDPYKVLISEFMLHRTRANQVVPVYCSVIEKYPTIDTFVQEKPEILTDQMESLGLFWRITGMIKAIEILFKQFNQVPSDYASLIEVEGIGPYIAGAVVCFSKNKPMALIDTNTVRVTGRVFGLDLRGEARRRKIVKETIEFVTPENNPRRYYYSLIDLAHQICHKTNPDCQNCPINLICQFYQSTPA